MGYLPNNLGLLECYSDKIADLELYQVPIKTSVVVDKTSYNKLTSLDYLPNYVSLLECSSNKKRISTSTRYPWRRPLLRRNLLIRLVTCRCHRYQLVLVQKNQTEKYYTLSRNVIVILETEIIINSTYFCSKHSLFSCESVFDRK